MHHYSSLFVLLLAFTIPYVGSPQEIYQKSSVTLDTVTTPKGKFIGNHCTIPGVRVFKGIPYAKPPVGALRWKATRPTKPSSNFFNTTQFGDNCMQSGGGPVAPTASGKPAEYYPSEYLIDKSDPQSEDCLCLNIWTPAKTSKDSLAVLVFIHGGGLGAGSGSIPLYHGEMLARKGIIVVTINYRLGAFGFIASPQDGPDSLLNYNFGLLDQIEALKWLQQCVGDFGGDPSRVTVAGQSAGAWSVSALLASPLAKDLFSRAIAQSGGLFCPTDTIVGMCPCFDPEHPASIDKNSTETFHAKTIKDLRSKPAKALLRKEFRTGIVVDGKVLPKDIYATFKSGRHANIPLLAGWTEHDATGFDWQTRTFASLMAKNGQENVYLYYFTKIAPGSSEEKALGAYHSSEIAYLFNNLSKWNRPWRNEDWLLADTIATYWANFVKTGNPNGVGLPKWPNYTLRNEQSLELGNVIRSIKTPGDETYHAYNKIFHYE